MWPILVHTLSCLLLISFVQVAEVAHEFGFVPAVVVSANRHTFKRSQYFHKERFCLFLARSDQVSLLVAVLPDVLLPFGDHSLGEVALLHLPLPLTVLLPLWLLLLLVADLGIGYGFAGWLGVLLD